MFKSFLKFIIVDASVTLSVKCTIVLILLGFLHNRFIQTGHAIFTLKKSLKFLKFQSKCKVNRYLMLSRVPELLIHANFFSLTGCFYRNQVLNT